MDCITDILYFNELDFDNILQAQYNESSNCFIIIIAGWNHQNFRNNFLALKYNYYNMRYIILMNHIKGMENRIKINRKHHIII